LVEEGAVAARLHARRGLKLGCGVASGLGR